MVTVLSRSESLDLVLATWRPKGDEDHFNIPDVHVFEACECEEDWHIPIAEAKKKPACDCGCGGKCTGAGGCSGGACKGGSPKGGMRRKKQRRANPRPVMANISTPDAQWVDLAQPLDRSTGRLRSQEQSSFIDATVQPIEVQKNGSRVDGSEEDCWVSVTEPPPENYEPGSPEWYAWWNGCVPTGPVGPGVAECDLVQAWEDAIEFCKGRYRAQIEEEYGEPWYVVDNEISFDYDYNFVYYAWINDRCEVVDAMCGEVEGGSEGWLIGLAVAVGVGAYLLWESGSDQEPDNYGVDVDFGGTDDCKGIWCNVSIDDFLGDGSSTEENSNSVDETGIGSQEEEHPACKGFPPEDCDELITAAGDCYLACIEDLGDSCKCIRQCKSGTCEETGDTGDEDGDDAAKDSTNQFVPGCPPPLLC